MHINIIRSYLTSFIIILSVNLHAENNDLFLIKAGESIGGITANTSIEEIKNLYKKENVTSSTCPIGEGEMAKCIILYKGTKNELEIIDYKTYGWLKWAKIYNKGSKWHTANGIKIGTTLQELIKLNGRNFPFFGFGFDGSGHIPSWEKGELDKGYSKNDGIWLNLNYSKSTENKKINLMHRREPYFSNHPKLINLELHVGYIRVMLK